LATKEKEASAETWVFGPNGDSSWSGSFKTPASQGEEKIDCLGREKN